jgi:hypothetical protein
MGRKLIGRANLSLVGLVIQKTNPAGGRRDHQRMQVSFQRWMLRVVTLTVGGGILFGALRMFGIV